MNDQAFGALLALLGVLVGVGLTYANARRSNEISERNAQRVDSTTRSIKLSEHRLLWIQKLRDEMAVFQSWGMTPGVDHAAKREFYEHGTRIELLMNPRDPDYRALQGLMYRLLSADGIDEKYSVSGEYVELCQGILKREWEIAKMELLAK